MEWTFDGSFFDEIIIATPYNTLEEVSESEFWSELCDSPSFDNEIRHLAISDITLRSPFPDFLNTKLLESTFLQIRQVLELTCLELHEDNLNIQSEDLENSYKYMTWHNLS